MRAALMAAAVLSGSVGFALGRVWGISRARQMRAWNDFLATKDSMRGLFRRAVDQWVRAAKVALVLVVLLAGLVLVVVKSG